MNELPCLCSKNIVESDSITVAIPNIINEITRNSPCFILLCHKRLIFDALKDSSKRFQHLKISSRAFREYSCCPYKNKAYVLPNLFITKACK